MEAFKKHLRPLFDTLPFAVGPELFTFLHSKTNDFLLSYLSAAVSCGILIYILNSFAELRGLKSIRYHVFGALLFVMALIWVGS